MAANLSYHQIITLDYLFSSEKMTNRVRLKVMYIEPGIKVLFRTTKLNKTL